MKNQTKKLIQKKTPPKPTNTKEKFLKTLENLFPKSDRLYNEMYT